MYPVSDLFKAELKHSHKIATKVEVYNNGALVQELNVIGGQVNASDDAAIRRRCKFTVVDRDGSLVPTSADSLLAPYGNEVRMYRGLGMPENTEELVPLGIFNISAVQVVDTGEGVKIFVEGFDRARKVQRNRFTFQYIIGAGSNYATAIQDLIEDRYPGLTYNFMPVTTTTPLLSFESGSDPWEAAQKMATSIGAELYFDVEGVCVLRPIPDPATDPVVWTYAEGAEATILHVEKKSSDERTYNHIIVTGESSNAPPVRAEAKDDDPSSPTYYLGDYGDVPYFYKSAFITTQAQAQAVADALLLRTLGVVEQVNFTAIVNPAHEVGDIIEITRGRAGINARYVLTDFNVNLDPQQPMNASTRRRQA